MRVLTVGEGDLSYSLALQRAFGGTIQLTATVLPNEDELAATYANAAANAAELQGCGAVVRYGVDATALATAELGEPYEAVVFSHPHLGLADLHAQAAHAQRHSVLVAHFLHSASSTAVLAPARSVTAFVRSTCARCAGHTQCSAYSFAFAQPSAPCLPCRG